MPEIIQMIGTRDQKIAKAQRIKAEFDTMPELVELRRQLIEAGMCKDAFSSVSKVVTENIHYSALKDDPLRYHKLYQLPPIITEEIRRDVQNREQHPFSAAELVRNSRGGSRRR